MVGQRMEVVVVVVVVMVVVVVVVVVVVMMMMMCACIYFIIFRTYISRSPFVYLHRGGCGGGSCSCFELLFPQ